MRQTLTIPIVAVLVLTIGCGKGDGVETRSGGDQQAPDVSSTVTPLLPSAASPTSVPASVERPSQGVYGRVADASGRPIASAMVQPAPGPGNPAPEREVFATTAADGSYGIALLPGAWDLAISANGHASTTLHVTVPEKGAVSGDVTLAAS